MLFVVSFDADADGDRGLLEIDEVCACVLRLRSLQAILQAPKHKRRRPLRVTITDFTVSLDNPGHLRD